MSEPQSLEDLLKDQLKTAEELDVVTSFILNRNTVRGSLIEVKKDIDQLKLGLSTMKEDLNRMKQQNEVCKNLTSSYTELDKKIKYLENNVPVSLLQALKQPKVEYVKPQASVKSTCKTRRMNATTPGTIKSTNSLTHKFDPVDDTLNITEFYPETQDCRKMLFREESEEVYLIEPLSSVEFSKIPKYMLGRQTINHINDFITTVNNVLSSKYGLLSLGKNGARKKGELELYLQFKKEQMDVYPNGGGERKYFFTGDDYHRKIKLKLDKTKLNMLTILRHCKRIQELRNGKNVRYEIITN